MEKRNKEVIKELPENHSAFIMSIIDMIDNDKHSVGAHALRTSSYSKIIAKELLKKGYYCDQIDDEFILYLVEGSLLHDIGKMYTPDGILNKPGKLTPEEFEIMKRHTLDGGLIIDDFINKNKENVELVKLLNFAKDMALCHHEKWNGTGYPFGLSKEEIPLAARIISIADVFDALTSKRVYRNAMSIQEALEIINAESGNQFDPKVVSAFLSGLSEIQAIGESKEKNKT